MIMDKIKELIDKLEQKNYECGLYPQSSGLIEDAKNIREQLHIEIVKENELLHSVSNQRKLLIAFAEWYTKIIPSYETTEEDMVDTYIKESNL